MARTGSLTITGAPVWASRERRFVERDLFIVDGEVTTSPDPAAMVVDGSGSWVVPGFVDAHFHAYATSMDGFENERGPLSYSAINGARRLESALRRGFTTVRDVSGPYRVPRYNLYPAAELDGGPRAPEEPAPVRLPLAAERIRQLAEASLDRLRERERAHGTLPVADRIAELAVPAFHTINHPANEVLALLASAVRADLGADPSVAVPARTLLGDVLAPLEPQVLAALEVTGPSRADWTVNGDEVSDALVRSAHLDWYRANPVAVWAGVERHRRLLADLGLGA